MSSIDAVSSDDAYINGLISLIPAQQYLASLMDEQPDSKYMHNKRVKSNPKDLKARKRARLDPDNYKSVQDIQEERLAEKLVAQDGDEGDSKCGNGLEVGVLKLGASGQTGKRTIKLGELAKGSEALLADVADRPYKRKVDKQKLVKILEKEKKHEEELDAEERKALLKEKAMEKAIKLASGEKVKDDIKLLKKTMKREKKEKERKSLEWEKRKKAVQIQKNKRQQTRSANIAKRKQAKTSSKSAKKGKGKSKK